MTKKISPVKAFRSFSYLSTVKLPPNGIEQSWPYFEYNSEFKTNIQAVVSRLVQEKSIDTAEEAVEAIKTECAHLF